MKRKYSQRHDNWPWFLKSESNFSSLLVLYFQSFETDFCSVAPAGLEFTIFYLSLPCTALQTWVFKCIALFFILRQSLWVPPGCHWPWDPPASASSVAGINGSSYPVRLQVFLWVNLYRNSSTPIVCVYFLIQAIDPGSHSRTRCAMQKEVIWSFRKCSPNMDGARWLFSDQVVPSNV